MLNGKLNSVFMCSNYGGLFSCILSVDKELDNCVCVKKMVESGYEPSTLVQVNI